MLSKHPLLHLLDKGNASKVHILIREILQNILIVNGLRLHILVINQLRGPEYEGQKVIIIKPPHTMGPSRLQAVLQLQLPHEVQVLHKHPGHHGGVVLHSDDPEPREAVQPRREIGLVAGAIVDAARVPEGVGEVGHEFNCCGVEILR